jgi:16S rRNA (cytosine1402-N4)-methyltransferase
VTLDLGVSSMQIDDPARGFAFAKDGPLDMRMDKSGQSAAELVNSVDEGELADIIHAYGEERLARRIARAIVAARTQAPIETTGQLADIVRAVAAPRKRSRSGRDTKIDPATRTFQALRIKVNDELAELERGLGAAEAILKPGGRLAIVSFHSLEDRRVKIFLRQRSGTEGRGSRHQPDIPAQRDPAWRLIERRAIKPSETEIAQNPRARSARLRVAERTEAPSWGPGRGVKRPATLILFALSVVAGAALFAVSFEVSELDERLIVLNEEITRDREAIHVLRAEWAYLNQPERLESLSQRYLDLKPLEGGQFIEIAALPARPVPEAILELSPTETAPAAPEIPVASALNAEPKPKPAAPRRPSRQVRLASQPVAPTARPATGTTDPNTAALNASLRAILGDSR